MTNTPAETPSPRLSPTPPRVLGDLAAPGNALVTPAATEDTPPVSEEQDPAAYGGLLFLGGFGSMLVGGVYVLFRRFKKKRRPDRDRP